MDDLAQYAAAIELFIENDDDLIEHERTCGECKTGPCPLWKDQLEHYNFARMAVRIFELANGQEDTALPRL